MTIKMIATDIDGTFITNGHDFDRMHFKRVLGQLEQRHVHFVIASGNQLKHLTDMFADYDNIAFLAENGGLVSLNDQVIFADTVSATDLNQALTMIRTDPVLTGGMVILSGRHGAYVERDTNAELMEQANYFYSGLQLCDRLTDVHDDMFKLDLVWLDDQAGHRADYLNHHLPKTLSATASGFGGLDIIPAHINKQVGLHALERYWHIKPDDVMAFGDNDNDIAMLAHAGHSFAMANASAKVQQSAKAVTEWTNDDDGVLRTIDMVLGLTN
ncbi:Cof-type HAD-IIB family hydrolase [Furfurilactobacillus milii]|uniref:HAD-IIB family hydrolase n=1 Tax=Furfurilactobacillus milii TaxID=2888272 RepID=A0A6N9I5Q1_9LACO|nr:Cof-type HAD-IIB family hydrolase [Furfurilactobacillus milii]MYV17756.1 HAD-IIB family hydrolase [Furfurilactobacillus milii]